MKFDNKTTRRDIFRLLYPEKSVFPSCFHSGNCRNFEQKKMAQFRNAFLFDNTVIMLLILYNNIPTVCVCIESERALLWGATIKSLSF